MKYVNSRDLMMFLPQPITKLGVFEAETVDAALTMCADAFPKIEQEFKVTVDFATFKFQLLKTMVEFLYKCAECPHECLKNPRKIRRRNAISEIISSFLCGRSVCRRTMQKTFFLWNIF
ncbi:MAG: hypothetical protein ACLTDX_06830 [[Clostridium] innocuum]